jgi:hypothetical protein
MRFADDVHYLVTMGTSPDVQEFDRLEDACDAIVRRLPIGGPFSIRRVREGGAPSVVLSATKSTVRPEYRGS